MGGDRVTLADITIEDNGIGFDNKNFDRLSIYKDDTKGFNNRGSGRIQMIHSFQYVNFDSIYWDGTRTMKRKFALSKTNPFLRNNTILYKTEEPSPVDGEEVKTTVKMAHPIEAKDAKIYAELGCEDIKKALFNHYLLAFCNIKSSFPSINIIYFVGGIEKDRERIAADEIPEPTQKDITISVPVCKMSEDMKRIENVENTSVSINVLPYKISSSILPASAIKITSKNEISETTKIKLTCIDPNASLDGYRYLFLLKSDYFDALDSDERGNIEIIDKTDLKNSQAQGYIDEQIVLNDIQDGVNNKAREIYQEISIQNEHFHRKIEQVKKRLLTFRRSFSGCFVMR